AEQTQRSWIESLRQQAVQPNLSFAFLARNLNEQKLLQQSPQPTDITRKVSPPFQRGTIFLNLLSWANETDREDFYSDAHYQANERFIGKTGKMRILTIDPL
ncbi:MAG: hypothetical protein M3Z24_06590, partial [Chloroflexota bacterium]|nr:hypothetical protein [Chloroflexota bacterium]